MKKIIGLFVLPLFPLFSYSQEIQQKNVPAVVLNAFQLKFSNATDIDWKLEKGIYQVSFEVNDKDNELLMNDKGIIIKHLQDLYVSEIPKAVLETIKSRIAFFDVNDADRVAEGGKISYNIKMVINEKPHEFIIDEKGKLMKYTRELRSSEIPAKITSLIKTKYGSLDVDDAGFSEDNGKISYRIEGEINDMDHTFIFDDKATIIRHEQDLRNSELPVQILNASKTSYNGYEIRNADLSEEGGKIIFHLEMRRSKERIFVSFNSDGKILEVINR